MEFLADFFSVLHDEPVNSFGLLYSAVLFQCLVPEPKHWRVNHLPVP